MPTKRMIAKRGGQLKFVKRALVAANGLLALAIIILLLTVGLPGNIHTGTNWILTAAVAATVCWAS